MASRKVLSTGPLDGYAEKVLGAFGEYVVAPDTSEETLKSTIGDAVALAVRGVPPISASVINAGKDLKVIGRTGVGYSNVDIEAATTRRIPVIYTPGAGARAVAEGSVTFMLALSKLVFHWDREMKGGNWKSRFGKQGRDLDGSTAGIIGLGRIGQILAELLRPFNVTVLAYDPFVPASRAKELGVEMVSLEDLLKRSDFISLHCAETAENKGLINRERLKLVKKGSYLINLSRGGLVESLDVLYEALQDGTLAGVGLDVFEPEPPDVSHPIFKLENCITSPHSMGTTVGAMTRIYKSMADDMAAVLRNERPQFVVNPEVFD